MLPLRVLLFAAGLLSAPLAAQAVITVDDDGPADFTDIQDAVAAAPDGATVLVRDGFYNGAASIDVQGKSLVLTAEAGASVRIVNGPVTIRQLTADQTVVLRGVTIAPAPLGEGLHVEDCLGVVWVEDVVLEAAQAVLILPNDVMTVIESQAVVVARSTIEGSAATFVGQGGAGIRVQRSSLHLFESAVMGGPGASDGSTFGSGGPGVALDESFLFAGASTLTGGTGAPAGNVFGCTGAVSGDGGVGLLLDGASTDARLLGTELVGGSPGSVTGTCTPGAVGDPVLVQGGLLTEAFWPDHGFSVDGPVPVSAGSTARFTGVPGEFAWYLFAQDAGALFLPTVLGTLVLEAPLFAVPVGTLDGGGQATAPLSAALPPGATSVTFLLQALYFDGASGQFTLSTPAALVVLADGI